MGIRTDFDRRLDGSQADDIQDLFVPIGVNSGRECLSIVMLVVEERMTPYDIVRENESPGTTSVIPAGWTAQAPSYAGKDSRPLTMT